MRIAITTDWLVTLGGAERVIGEMMKIWPRAEVFTTVHNTGTFKLSNPCAELERSIKTFHTSFLQKYYNIIGNHRILLPWMPRAVESWDLRNFDIIVSSSHAVAKGCIPASTAQHICYCHTPMRYIWEMEEEYLHDFKVPSILKPLIRRQLAKLRRWDLTTAKRVDQFIANSNETAKRIKRIYGRDSIVLHPPVDDRFFNCHDKTLNEMCHPERRSSIRLGCDDRSRRMKYCQPYFLAVGRLVPYKRFDLIIDAANKEGFHLKIIGNGPQKKRLQKLAGKTVEILGHIAEEDLPKYYANARATIFPVFEDAGIVPLESQACGTPVIALKKGGVLDTVCDGETGIFFNDQTVESLIDAMKKFDAMTFDAQKICEHAKQFSSEKFREKLKKIIEEAVL